MTRLLVAVVEEEKEEEEAKHLRHRHRLLSLLLLLAVVLLGLPWEVVREAGAADPSRRCRCRCHCWAGFAERRCEGCRIGGEQTPPPHLGGKSWRRRKVAEVLAWRTELVPLEANGCEERQTTR